jgi:hypothetical protein
MKRTIDHQYSMHVNVHGVCDKNRDILLTIIVFLELMKRFEKDISIEKELGQRLIKLRSNSATPKDLARAKAMEIFLDLSSKLMSLAWVKNNMNLYQEVKYTKTDMVRASDPMFIRICGNLIKSAKNNLAQLAQYNVNVQTLIDDEAVLLDFEDQRKVFIDTRREYFLVNRQLADQVKTTNNNLKSIDTIINSLRLSHPELAGEYWRARKVPRTVYSKVDMKGKVFDAATGQWLNGAIVTVTQVAGASNLAAGQYAVRIVKVKSVKGGFELKSLSTGTYTLKVKFYGYAELEVTVYINDGILTNVDLPLTRLE